MPPLDRQGRQLAPHSEDHDHEIDSATYEDPFLELTPSFRSPTPYLAKNINFPKKTASNQARRANNDSAVTQYDVTNTRSFSIQRATSFSHQPSAACKSIILNANGRAQATRLPSFVRNSSTDEAHNAFVIR